MPVHPITFSNHGNAIHNTIVTCRHKTSPHCLLFPTKLQLLNKWISAASTMRTENWTADRAVESFLDWIFRTNHNDINLKREYNHYLFSWTHRTGTSTEVVVAVFLHYAYTISVHNVTWILINKRMIIHAFRKLFYQRMTILKQINVYAAISTQFLYTNHTLTLNLWMCLYPQPLEWKYSTPILNVTADKRHGFVAGLTLLFSVYCLLR